VQALPSILTFLTTSMDGRTSLSKFSNDKYPWGPNLTITLGCSKKTRLYNKSSSPSSPPTDCT
jgi:hypothetical protein